MFTSGRLNSAQTQMAEKRKPLTQVNRLPAGFVQTQARVVALQEQLTEAEREKLKISSQTERLEDLLKEERGKVRELQQLLQAAESECDGLSSALQEARGECEERARADLGKLQLQFDLQHQELSEARALIPRLRKQLDDTETQLLETRSRLRDEEAAVERSHVDLNNMEQRLQQTTLQYDKMAAEKNAEIAKLLAAVESLNAELHLIQRLPPNTRRAASPAPPDPDKMLALLNRVDQLEAQLAAKCVTTSSTRSHSSGGPPPVKPKPVARQDMGVRLVGRAVRPMYTENAVYTSVPPNRGRPQGADPGLAARRDVTVPDFSRRSPERPSLANAVTTSMDRLEAALSGITGIDDRDSLPSSAHSQGSVEPRRPLNTGPTTSSRWPSHPLPTSSSRAVLSAMARMSPEPCDVLTQTYPQNRHQAYEPAGEGARRPCSPPRKEDTTRLPSAGRREEDPRTVTYPRVYRPQSPSAEDLHDELEAVKRETARLRRSAF